MGRADGERRGKLRTAVRLAQETDKDGRPVYQCSTCTLQTRAQRLCPLWPPPDLAEAARVAPTVLRPGMSRDEVRESLRNVPALPIEVVTVLRDFADALRTWDAATKTHQGADHCAWLDVDASSRRYLSRYHRLVAFSGLGGTTLPDPHTIDTRTMHALLTIRSATADARAREDGSDGIS